MNNLHRIRSRKVVLGLISLATIFALCFGGSGTQAARAQANGVKVNSSSTPAPLIVHPYHYYKPVCQPTNEPGMANCTAEIITDATGKILSFPASLLIAPSGYGPAAFRGAYGVTGTTSTTRTVAIVDAYDDPTVLTDLNAYSSYYGIPTMSQCAVSGGTATSPCFQKVDESGGISYPPYNSNWSVEIALDVEAVHAMCQNCNILLVEAASNYEYDLIAAADQRAYLMGANVVSNSWGGSEFSGETDNDKYFHRPGVAFVFSSGDNGYGVQYPAASPNVTAVGGTKLLVNSDYSYNSETAWGSTTPLSNGAGSGCSAYESKPSFQHDADCSNRTVADVSADADPSTGASVYLAGSWYQIGGTSLAAPLVASVYALAGGVGTTLGNSLPYANVSYGVNLRDVTIGANGSCGGSYLCTAQTGYDGPTGLGTPLGLAAFTTNSSFQSSGAYDGWILASSAANTTGGTIDSNSTVLQLGDDAKNRQYKTILSFNTSSLPDTAVIQSATLKIHQNGLPIGTNPFTIMGNLWVDIRKGWFGSSSALESADFSAGASATKVASFGKTPVSGWYSAVINTGLGHINKVTTNGGLTQFRLYFNLKSNNNHIADYMKFLSGNYTTVTSRPQLIITYYVP